MILLIDTTNSHIAARLPRSVTDRDAVTVIDTEGMRISHCVGCNYCWLKTPGVCCLKDDYAPILKKMHEADQVWLLADTRFGFVSYKAKNIIDRVMPLVTMNLAFKNGEMRHVMRYAHNPDLGLIYTSEGDHAYLTRWMERVAINFGTKSLGAYAADQSEEAAACML